MKRFVMMTGLAALTGLVMFDSGCEWSGGGGAGSFNTSQGAGINVNFSGVYHGNYSDGKAVATSSGAPISRLTLTQSGNSIEVIDNNGNRYKGNVGSPGIVYDLSSGAAIIPAGAELMQAQVNFDGVDGSSGHHVQFVGIVHVVAINDVKTTTQTSGENSGSGSTNATSATGTASTTQTETHNTNGTTTITITQNTPPNVLVTTRTYSDATGQLLSETITQSASQGSSNSQGQSQTQTTTKTYSITEANSQYRLEGQWVEKDGNTSGVDALSPAGSGVVSQQIN